MAHDVLGQEDDDEVSGGLPAHRADVVDDRAGDVPVGGVQDRQGHGDVGLLPGVQEALGAAVTGVHRQGLQDGGVGRLGVGQGPQRGLVEAGGQDDGVDVGRQDAGVVEVGDGHLLADPAVVAADPVHHQVEQRHDRQGDPGSPGELGEQDDDQDRPGAQHTDGVDDAGAVHARAVPGLGGDSQLARPVTHHAHLGEREGDEHAHDVELDETGRVGLEADEEGHGPQPQDDDAVGEGQAVAALGELAGQELVTGQDAGQHREPVEGGVGGQDQDQPGDGGDQVEHRAEAGEDGGGDLSDRGVLVVGVSDRDAVAQELMGRVLHHAHADGAGQVDDAHEHQRGDPTQEQQRGGGVAGLGALEAGHAVGDRLHTGQGRAPRGEGPQDQEASGQAGQALLPAGVGDDVEAGRLGPPESPGQLLDEPDDGHDADDAHVQVGGNGEGPARLA